MIERRKEPRMRLTLPVTIFGIDSEGERFTALAMATNFSPTGALLTGFDVELRCGDTMVVAHEGHRAQFRIVWVLNRPR